MKSVWVLFKEFIHFGLTSQDINNTSVPLSIKKAMEEVYYPELDSLIKKLTRMADEWRDVSMLAKTHGQPVPPTRLGKEIMVFVSRLNQQLALLRMVPHSAKFGGATGNFNAHHVAYPAIDWRSFANKFTHEKLGLERSSGLLKSPITTIWPLCLTHWHVSIPSSPTSPDIWSYVSMEYLKQKNKSRRSGFIGHAAQSKPDRL